MVWAGSAEAAPAHHPCRWGARRGLANDLTGSHECADLKASCFLGSRPTYPSLVLAHAAPPPLGLCYALLCGPGTLCPDVPAGLTRPPSPGHLGALSHSISLSLKHWLL